jgi:hypothetical protein
MTLNSAQRLRVKEESLYEESGVEFGLDQSGGGVRLAVLAPRSSMRLQGFEGERTTLGSDHTLLLGPLTRANASALRAVLPALRPVPLGLATSAGFGDRLGLATPGHVRALRAAGGEISPIFAQQSIREMERTGRSPHEVMDDATWGLMSEGWRGEIGADADHLKTFEHIDVCLEAGYTFFTFDPGEHVDDSAERLPANGLNESVDSLPWRELGDSVADLRQRYLGKRFEFEGETLEFDEESLYRAAAKYGRAVDHAVNMYRYLEKKARDGEFEVEVSVDETASPTTHLQHVYIATELKRLGVRWVSLAPRYVGTFEKGVDYIGDPETFERDFALHAAIARELGPYKLSLHSGSDKFSIYEAASRQTQGMVHLKTAGTSYLEALKTIARADPSLFRDIYAFARDRFDEDRASYHVSASVEAAPEDAEDGGLPGLVDEFNAREILHVTFGSVLGDLAGEHDLKQRLLASLDGNEEDYASGLESHFLRHLRPFVAESRASHGEA